MSDDTQKVAINAKHGGFGISDEAIDIAEAVLVATVYHFEKNPTDELADDGLLQGIRDVEEGNTASKDDLEGALDENSTVEELIEADRELLDALDDEPTITVPVSEFAFWQSQMAHASERATNDPDHDGDAVHQAHEEMYAALQSFHDQ